MTKDLTHHACPHCGRAFLIDEALIKKVVTKLGAKGGSASGSTKARPLSSEQARKMRAKAPRNTRAGKPVAEKTIA